MSSPKCNIENAKVCRSHMTSVARHLSVTIRFRDAHARVRLLLTSFSRAGTGKHFRDIMETLLCRMNAAVSTSWLVHLANHLTKQRLV